jgi:hypothetical protein
MGAQYKVILNDRSLGPFFSFHEAHAVYLMCKVLKLGRVQIMPNYCHSKTPPAALTSIAAATSPSRVVA